jgi:hypothetical protein
MGDRSDLEDEHDGVEPDEEGEPSLGSRDSLMNQPGLASAGRREVHAGP